MTLHKQIQPDPAQPGQKQSSGVQPGQTRPSRMRPSLKRQAGVAVVTALLLTTLILITISSLRMQQQVQMRLIENHRLRLQARWITLGAVDLARFYLNDDAKNSTKDDLTEPWALPIAEMPVTTYAEKGQEEDSRATVSGRITDATSRYNLANLAYNRVISKSEVAALKKLLTSLRLNPELATKIAQGVAAGQSLTGGLPAVPAGGTPAPNPGQTPAPTPTPGPNPNPNPGTNPGANPLDGPPLPPTPGQEPAPIVELDDLLSLPGFNQAILDNIKNYVIILPRPTANLTPINVNTASAEVLSARIDTLSLSQAKSVTLARDRTVFRDLADFTDRVQRLTGATVSNQAVVATTTNYFLVFGRARNEHAIMETNALVERSTAGTRVLWMREN